jgi:hypothetical protein
MVHIVARPGFATEIAMVGMSVAMFYVQSSIS